MKYKIFLASLMLSFTFASYGQKKQVIFILLEDCVICQSYSITMNKLYEEYGNEFEFIGYFPNFSSKREAIDSFKNVYSIPFPLKTDYFKTVTNKFKVEVTPEVVIYDPKFDRILYQGRIDNEFFDIGQRRSVVSQHELKDALQAISTKSNNYIKRTISVGCFINFDPMNENP